MPVSAAYAIALARAGAAVVVNDVSADAANATVTRTVPYFAAAIAADDAGEPMPDFYRKTLGLVSPRTRPDTCWGCRESPA